MTETALPGPPTEGPGPLFCGVDVGASATKLVLVDGLGNPQARAVRPSGIDYAQTAARCLDEALSQIGADRGCVTRTLSTGYGRGNVTFADDTFTELHCHGIGCFHWVRHGKTAADTPPRPPIDVVDIGGQDNKIIHLDPTGRRVGFKMNRKCAAGTGAFIEEIALRLSIDIGEMESFAHSSTQAVRLSSFCTVFAKTEILAHLRRGTPVADIVRGAFVAVVKRVVEMDRLAGTVLLTGGVVAHNPTVADLLSEQIGLPVQVPPFPQHTGALGAALLAARQSADPAPASE